MRHPNTGLRDVTRVQLMRERIGLVSRFAADAPRYVDSVRLGLPGRNRPSEKEHVFVIGIPRAGTTLMNALLCSHRALCGLDQETHFFVINHVAGLSISGIRKDCYDRLVRRARSRVELFDLVAEAVIQRNRPATRFVEKTPGHGIVLGQLLRLYPNARFVFMVRDPRDAFLSGKSHPRFYGRNPSKFASFYRLLLKTARDAEDRRVLFVRYEDLAEAPFDTMGGVFAHLGVEMDETVFDPAALARHSGQIISLGGHDRIRKPIDASSVGRWKVSLSGAEAEEIGNSLADLLPELGYEDCGRAGEAP
ncbi:MAG: hypothetical protein GC201_06830 [Alphaproteobacteria bacterium]|nr:hypothetical protein [Alphaproteobacteria bacterium]